MAKAKTPMDRGGSKWLTCDNTGYVKWMDTSVVHVILTAFSQSEMKEAMRTQRDGTSVKVQYSVPNPFRNIQEEWGC